MIVYDTLCLHMMNLQVQLEPDTSSIDGNRDWTNICNGILKGRLISNSYIHIARDWNQLVDSFTDSFMSLTQ